MRNYLVDIRETTGVTQQDVADKISISRQSYQAIEAGRRQADLKTSMIAKLADVFGMTASEIYRMEADYQAERTAVLQAQGLAPANNA